MRNVVLWIEDMEINCRALQKLRGLGMNIVLFDYARKSNYADSVCLDNEDAVAELVDCLKKSGCKNLGYVGWDDAVVASIRIREEEFLTV